MGISLASIPRFTVAQALDTAQRDYGIHGTARTLPSERDQNFLITTRGGDKFVLKIANADDSTGLLDFQNQAMRRVRESQAVCAVQEAIRSRHGREVELIRGDGTGAPYGVRVLTWLRGEVLEREPRREPSLLESIGTALARIDLALRDFTHPDMHRTLQWDLRHAPMARAHLALLSDLRRPGIERHFDRWKNIDWTSLRHGVIHGDANDHNVLVADRRMTGLLDFGDMVFTATVCELAIALAYGMLGAPRPLDAAAPMVRAYCRIYPLTEAERRALPTLVLTRLCMSVCYSAHNRARNPADPYQVVSEAAAWDLLDRLEPLAAAGKLDFAVE